MLTNRLIRVPGILAAAALVLSGCGSGQAENAHQPSGTHVMPDGTVMSGSQMASMSTTAGPSDAASMICSSEVTQSVQRNFALTTTPMRQHAWADQIYSCQYRLPHSTLRISVKDLDSEAPGTAYFAMLRHMLPRASPIGGLSNLGLPAFQTPTGDVAFLKDHRTLWVDAANVATGDLPPGFTRAEVAYSIAASVIACWSE